jgi:hypothetical protein
MDLDKEHGFINSSCFDINPQEIFELCTKEENLKKLFTNLPLVDLKLSSARQIMSDHYEIKWKSHPKSKIKLTLSFLLKKAQLQGTILSTEAVMEKFHIKDELMNVFLLNMRNLLSSPRPT